MLRVAAGMFVTGLGMGLSSSPVVVAVQSVVGWEHRGVVTGGGIHRIVASVKAARATPRFPEAETVPLSAQVERRFMEWMLRDNAQPGTAINELELARHFGVATTGIREFLNRFQRFGLIEKFPNSGWVFKGFTPEFSLELFEIREMFELRSAMAFAALPRESPMWAELDRLETEHVQLAGDIAARFNEFSELDERFHRLIHRASLNRFIVDFYDVIAMIFHYHYQWNKAGERQRNEVAVQEHLAYIAALRSRDPARVDAACRRHLKSARHTLLTSMPETPGDAPSHAK